MTHVLPQQLSRASAPSDVHGRLLSDLRISVTDRCNFRCTYCLPRDKVDGAQFLPRSEVLDFEEIQRVARLFVGLGVRKLRITGGEPLLRRDLPRLIEMLASLGVEIALTSNGVLLPRLSAALKGAGVTRVTVSLDALDEAVFQRVCDAPGYTVQDVLAGIDAAERAGFFGIKVNCVVRRGQNEDQIVPLVRLFSGRDIEVRFIEYMDVGTINGWDSQAVVRREEILARLAELGAWEPLPAERASDVASRFVGPAGTVGIISSVSAPFCGSCSRARLSADGKLFGCLFAANGLSLKAPLRRGASDEELSYLIQEFWRHRADRYSEQRQQVARLRRQLPIASGRVEMAYIGG